MTRMWTLSDLHQEFVREPSLSKDRHVAFDPADHVPEDGFDIAILAGDIDVPLTRSLQWIADRFAGTPVMYVPGNHDFFVGEHEKYTMSEQLEQGRELADWLGIHLLLDGSAVIDGVRFLGGTLWTDFMTIGRGDYKTKSDEAASRDGMNDYRDIRRWSSETPGKRKRLRPQDTVASHMATRAYLEAELAVPFEGQTVVVSHHAPHPGSLDSRHGGQLDWCYASNLTTILEGEHAPDVWIHGHIHQHRDYQVGHTRVIANPRGYQFIPRERDNGFDASFVVTIDQPVPRPGVKL